MDFMQLSTMASTWKQVMYTSESTGIPNALHKIHHFSLGDGIVEINSF